MLTKWLGNTLATASFLILLGCGEKGADQRLVEIVVKQAKQEKAMNRMASRMEGIERTLREIQESLRGNIAASVRTEPAEATKGRAVDFRNTPEYTQMAAALSAIQQRLNLAESAPLMTKEDRAEALELVQRKEAVTQFNMELKSIYNPEAMRETLEIIVENHAQDIDAPVRRQEFDADIEQLRKINSDDTTQEELYDHLVSDLRQRLDASQDQRAREWLQRQLSELETASADELDRVLQQCRCLHNFLRIRELPGKYGYRDDGSGIRMAPWEK
jgi:hypothetical protein